METTAALPRCIRCGYYYAQQRGDTRYYEGGSYGILGSVLYQDVAMIDVLHDFIANWYGITTWFNPLEWAQAGVIEGLF